MIVVWPGGTSTSNGWAESVTCFSKLFGPRSTEYFSAEPFLWDERANAHTPSEPCTYRRQGSTALVSASITLPRSVSAWAVEQNTANRQTRDNIRSMVRSLRH